MVNKEEAKQEPVAWPEAPKEIYLVVCGDDDCDLPFREHCEVTWCEDRIHATDIRYVRADTHPAPEAKQEALLDSTVPPHALYYPLSDYHRAPAEGPLNFTWIDKPHRLLYDLIAAVKFYANPAPSVNAQEESNQCGNGAGCCYRAALFDCKEERISELEAQNAQLLEFAQWVLSLKTGGMIEGKARAAIAVAGGEKHE